MFTLSAALAAGAMETASARISETMHNREVLAAEAARAAGRKKRKPKVCAPSFLTLLTAKKKHSLK